MLAMFRSPENFALVPSRPVIKTQETDLGYDPTELKLTNGNRLTFKYSKVQNRKDQTEFKLIVKVFDSSRIRMTE